ncbi:hypothetical protein JCM8097_005047 [Rhodosporidiobolus ruineniae]
MRSFVFLLASSLLLSPLVTASATGDGAGLVKRCSDHKHTSPSKHHGHAHHASKHHGSTAKHSSTVKAVKTTNQQTSAATASSSVRKTFQAASSRPTTSRFHTTTKAALSTSTVLASATAVNLAVSTSSKVRSTTPTRSTSKKASSTAAASTASSTAGASPLEKVALDTHNAIRANYSAPALVWFVFSSSSSTSLCISDATSTLLLCKSSELEQSATAWANKCDFNHGGGTALSSGENLGATYEDNLAGMITWWASEASEYDYSNPGWNYDAGHFTQVVWKSTTSLGCANVLCPTLTEGSSTIGTNEYLIVCHYLPAGNIDSAEECKANVLPHV